MKNIFAINISIYFHIDKNCKYISAFGIIPNQVQRLKSREVDKTAKVKILILLSKGITLDKNSQKLK